MRKRINSQNVRIKNVLFHDIEVIGLQYKYITKQSEHQVKDVGKIVHYFLKLRRETYVAPIKSPSGP